MNRRDFLRRSALVMGAGLGSAALGREVCKPTPAQQEGPYYPEHDLDRDADLVQRWAGAPSAEGQAVRIHGRVQDALCRPIAGALIEVWQACLSGRYDHSGDESALTLDPNFQFWGRARTDANGLFRFRTIIPGIYPAEPGRYRPPHVHFKVHAAGHPALTTQMYFDPDGIEDPTLAADAEKWNAFEKVPRDLLVHFTPVPELNERVGIFDISLR